MNVFVTREYQRGQDTGEVRVYAALEQAQRYFEGRFPTRDRFKWVERFPGRWLGRINGDMLSFAAYVDELPVIEGGEADLPQ